ncbi:MAG: hypothetical protein KC468_02535 [Myxococcales bacterium]|nr:hypothetical protein [Myxococcales bacterium]
MWLAPLLLAAGLELARAPAEDEECAAPEAPELLVIEVPEQPAETGPGCSPPPTPTTSPAPKAETLEASPEAPGPLMFVLDGRVLIDTDADPEWGRGRARADARGAGPARSVRRAAARKSVPEDLWKLSGERVVLYGPSGRVCEGRLDALSIAARYSGELELLYEEEARLGGDGVFDEARDAGVRLSRRVDERIYEDGPWSLEAALADTRGSCDGALWARLATDLEPAIYTTSAAGSPDERDAGAWDTVTELAAFRELRDGHVTFSQELGASPSEAEAAWARFVAEERRVQRWRDPASGDTLVTVQLGAPGVPSCGEFDGTLAALLRAHGDGGFELLEAELGARPIAIFDRDHDGAPELIVSSGIAIELELLERDDDAYDVVDQVEVPFFGCPC